MEGWPNEKLELLVWHATLSRVFRLVEDNINFSWHMAGVKFIVSRSAELPPTHADAPQRSFDCAD